LRNTALDHRTEVEVNGGGGDPVHVK
jgi:hypothetical protein